MTEQREFQKRVQSIERLLGEIDSVADPNLRATVQELVKSVMDLHGAGLERMIELVRVGDGNDNIIPKLGGDPLVSNLLVLYGLHPTDLEARVARALDKARSRLRSHDAEVEVLSIREGAVRLRLNANGHRCGSNADALKDLVEETVYEEAPDITSLSIEGAQEKQSFIPVEMLVRRAPALQGSSGLSSTASEKVGL